MSDHRIFYFCPNSSCGILITQEGQNFCPKCAYKRPESGWPSMETHPIANMPAPNPRVFLSPEGDLYIFPKFLGHGARVDLDETTGKGILTIRGRWKFTFSIPMSEGVVEVGLDPLLDNS